MKIDLKILEKYKEDGLITTRKHPLYDIYVHNYTIKCSFDRKWDDITMLCRGLVTDENGMILALPFKKFFNYGEREIDNKYLLQKPKKLSSKEDGSLGIIFNYNNEWIITTRGSFESDQAIKGQNILDYQIDLKSLNKNYTYLTEIIYPENHIVVNYPQECLYLLGINNNISCNELEINFEDDFGFKYPEEIEFDTLKELMEWMKFQPIENSEGWVALYDDGTRLKVKYENYVKLHKLVIGLNERRIWENLSAGNINELIKMIPEEYSEWAEKVIFELKKQFNIINLQVDIDYSNLELYRYKNNIINPLNKTRKEIAEEIKKTKYPGLLFAKLDGKEYKSRIWDIIKP